MYDSNGNAVQQDSSGNYYALDPATGNPTEPIYPIFDSTGNVVSQGFGPGTSGNYSSAAATQPAVADTSSGSFTDFFKNIFSSPQIPQTLLQLYQTGRQAEVANQLVQLNITRAQQGLPPLTMAQIGAQALTPGVNVGVGVSTTPTQNVFLFGLLGLGAFAILTRKKKR